MILGPPLHGGKMMVLKVDEEWTFVKIERDNVNFFPFEKEKRMAWAESNLGVQCGKPGPITVNTQDTGPKDLLQIRSFSLSSPSSCPRVQNPAPMAATPPAPAPPRILLAGDAHGRLHQLFKRVKSVATPSSYHSLFLLPLVPPVRDTVRCPPAGEPVDGAVPRAALRGAVLLSRGGCRGRTGGRRRLHRGARFRAHPDLLHRRLRPLGAAAAVEGRRWCSRVRARRHRDMPQPLLA